MMRTLLSYAAIVLAALVSPSLHAQAPETLLPQGACGYLRFDGWARHEAAYEKSALAEVMRGDLGDFLAHAGTLMDTQKVNLLKDLPIKERLQGLKSLQIGARAKDHLLEHGALLAVEVFAGAEQTHWQATLVFPDDAAQGKPGPVQRALKQGLAPDQETAKTVKRGGLSIHCVDGEGSSCSWWTQGGHFVVVVSTEKSQEALQRHEKRTGNVTEHPLFAATTGNHLLGGFVDVRPLLDLAWKLDESGTCKEVCRDLGILDIRGITYQAGFEGKAWHESLRLHAGAKRRGLLKVAGALRGVDLDHLPALPADATSVRISALDLAALAKETVATYHQISKRLGGEEGKTPTAVKKAADAVADENLFKELSDCLGPQIVTFNSPAEGPWFLGWGCAIQVRDDKRLEDFLALIERGQKLFKAFGAQHDYTLKKRTYHGVDLWSLQAKGMVVSPSFVLHDGWLVLGLYPQGPQGYVLRSQKKIPRWQPAQEFHDAIAAARKNSSAKIVSICQDDQRDTYKFILSLVPVLASLSIDSEAPLDTAFLPNPHAVTAPMFPTVTMVLDDGKTWSRERFGCLPIETDIGSLWLAGAAWGFVGETAGFLQFPPKLPWSPDVAAPAEGPPPVPEIVKTGGLAPATWECMNPTAKPDGGTYRIHYDANGKATRVRIDGDPNLLPPPGADMIPTITVPGGTLPATPLDANDKRATWWEVKPTAASSTDEKPKELAPLVASSGSESKDRMVVKVYDVSGMFDKEHAERGVTELTSALRLIEPDSWRREDDPGTIVVITRRERIVVRQTRAVHERIEKLLNELNTPQKTRLQD